MIGWCTYATSSSLAIVVSGGDLGSCGGVGGWGGDFDIACAEKMAFLSQAKASHLHDCFYYKESYLI